MSLSKLCLILSTAIAIWGTLLALFEMNRSLLNLGIGESLLLDSIYFIALTVAFYKYASIKGSMLLKNFKN